MAEGGGHLLLISQKSLLASAVALLSLHNFLQQHLHFPYLNLASDQDWMALAFSDDSPQPLAFLLDGVEDKLVPDVLVDFVEGLVHAAVVIDFVLEKEVELALDNIKGVL